MFWHLNPTRLRAFERAWLIKRKRKDEEQWFLYQYFCNAISVNFSKNATPITEPKLVDILLTEEERDDKEIQKMIAQEEAFAQKTKKRLAKRGEKNGNS